MNNKPLISISGLSKRFSRDIRYNMYYGLLDILGLGNLSASQRPVLRKHEFWALDEVELNLFEGEILGIVGANGSGKTSLIRVLMNIYPLDFGTIKGKKGLRITSIFALEGGMQPLFTGRENIYIKGGLFGMTKAEVEEKLDFIEAFSELGSKLDQPYGNYSSGMKARLSYSVAVATDSDVFIIDETLAVGDVAFRAKCFEHIRHFAKQPGKGIIFVTNHVKKVLKFATRIVVMEKGKVVFNSTDAEKALNFYIDSFYQDLSPELREKQVEAIRNFEF